MGSLTDEGKRIRSYLVTQGAKLSPAELVAKVRVAMGELYEAGKLVPSERFYDRPEPTEWSANEVLSHVVTSGARFTQAIDEVLTGRAPTPFARDDQGENGPHRKLDDWWQRLNADRENLFRRVLVLDLNAHPEQTIPHPFFGNLSWRETLLFFRLHDLDHAGQMQKIAAAFGVAVPVAAG